MIVTPFYLLWQCLIISNKDSQRSKNSIQQARMLNYCAAVKWRKIIKVLSPISLYYILSVALIQTLASECAGDAGDGELSSSDSFVSLGAPLWPRHLFLAQWSNGTGCPPVFVLFIWFPIAAVRENLENKSQSDWWNTLIQFIGSPFCSREMFLFAFN